MVWSVVLRLVLAVTILVAAIAKLANREPSRQAIAAYGLRGERAQGIVLRVLIAAEIAIAAGLAAGAGLAEWLGLVLVLGGAISAGVLIARGRGGAPCPCYGARTRISSFGVARDLLLAAGFAALIASPAYQPTRDELIAIGLGLALLLCLGLTLAVVALAREVGMLRMRLGPSAALEIAEEGPQLGEPTGLATRFDSDAAEILLAIFLSPACRVCDGLRPAIASIRSSERVAVEIFEEGEDDDPWEDAGIPGSPYAVAISAAGIVMAKGTFNNLAQLEGLIGTALDRIGRPAALEGASA